MAAFGGDFKKRRCVMIIDDWLHIIAGTLILISVALGTWVHPYWYFFTAFVGANLLQSGFSKTCPMVAILRKLGVPEKR